MAWRTSQLPVVSLYILSQVVMVRMRPNVGALRFPTLMLHSLSLFQVSFSCIILVSNMQTMKLTLHFDFISLYPELHPFALNHIFSAANEIALLKHNNHQISRLLSSNQSNFRKMEDNFCNFLWTSSVVDQWSICADQIKKSCVLATEFCVFKF